jgi:putative hydrolase of the HAD superfamily
MTGIKHLVFDMGGVLVRIHWHQEVSRMLQQDVPFEKIHALWGNAYSTHAFETGKLDFEGFTDAFLKEFKPDLTRDAFQDRFRNILDDDFPGTTDLLSSLRERYTLSLLSNTNPCHWEMLKARNTFLPLIEHHFISMALGIMKPEAAIYNVVQTTLNAHPDEILFFDDGLKNVAAARDLGWHAEQVFGPDDIREQLIRYRLL